VKGATCCYLKGRQWRRPIASVSCSSFALLKSTHRLLFLGPASGTSGKAGKSAQRGCRILAGGEGGLPRCRKPGQILPASKADPEGLLRVMEEKLKNAVFLKQH
jgi:hypothetical protein